MEKGVLGNTTAEKTLRERKQMKYRQVGRSLVIDLGEISPYLKAESYALACTTAYQQYLELKKGKMLWDVLRLLRDQYKDNTTENIVYTLLLSRELGKVFARNDVHLVPQFEDELKWFHNIMLKDALYYFYSHRLSLGALLIERGFRRSDLKNVALCPSGSCSPNYRITLPSQRKEVIVKKEEFRQKMRLKAMEMMLPESCRSVIEVLEGTEIVQQAIIRHCMNSWEKDYV